MRCPTCRHQMIVDHFTELEDETGHLWLRAWRCERCQATAESYLENSMLPSPLRLRSVVDRLLHRKRKPLEVIPLGA